jgi:alanine dehydrogenase
MSDGPATKRTAGCSTVSTVSKPVLILTRSQVAALMRPQEYLAAVEAGFRSYARGNAHVPIPMHVPVRGGGFHAKAGHVVLERNYVAVKVNGNFPGNPERHGLPTIQGVVVLCDAVDGSPLAIMDSIEITLQRTAAASALAARFLARPDADCIAICGCGEQGRAHLAALTEVMPLRRALVWDIDRAKACAFAAEMRPVLGLDVAAVPEVRDAALPSDVIVTATTARAPFLTGDMVRPGAFVAAVGADSPDKNELAPELMASATIVVDVLAQGATMGDLHHAIDAGVVTTEDVHSELGDLVIGRKPGRTTPDEITVFDSTGAAIQDVASAAWIYERAIATRVGSSIALGAR